MSVPDTEEELLFILLPQRERNGLLLCLESLLGSPEVLMGVTDNWRDAVKPHFNQPRADPKRLLITAISLIGISSTVLRDVIASC